MSTRKRNAMILSGIFVVYNLATGGGLLFERRDSVSTLGSVAEAQLTTNASIYLKATPTTTEVYLPFVCSYVRHGYPFQLRYYGSTRDETVRISESDGPESGTTVVVTGVHWYRKTRDGQPPQPSEMFHSSTWNGIIIPEPGDWVITSEGYIKHGNEKPTPTTFPAMTVRPTDCDQWRVTGLIYYLLSQIPV